MWENLLNPETLRKHLISASLYMAAYEVLKTSIIKRTEYFFLGTNRPEDKEKYEKAVLFRNRSPLMASLLWHQEMQAINENDLAAFQRMRHCRNELAHRLPDLIGGKGIESNLTDCFVALLELLRKIEVWWIREFEMSINPDFDGVEVADDQIMPGSIVMVKIMLDTALGDADYRVPT
jgi:hypothetical protein